MCPELRRKTRLRDRGRDPHHHNCVDRQVYRAAGMMVGGWLVGAVLPFGYAVVLLLVALVAYPLLELSWDGEQRRRARLTEADRRAGRH